MPRGGPRPGAGPPKRNLNALKHGRHSPLARAIFLYLLLRHPPAALRFLLGKKIKKANNQTSRAG